MDVRVIAASNVNLQEAVREGKFRDDLFYRLNVIAIHIPPLRERIEDIPLLTRQFVERISAEMGKEVRDIEDPALRLLASYDWPGNGRELRNAVERAIVITQNTTLIEEDFSFLKRRQEERAGWAPPADMNLRDIERRTIETTLERTGGNVKAAAEALSIDRSTLYDKIKRYDIQRPL